MRICNLRLQRETVTLPWVRFVGQPERNKPQVLWFLSSQVGFSATAMVPEHAREEEAERGKCTGGGEGLGLGVDLFTHTLCELKKEFLIRENGRTLSCQVRHN